MAVPVRRVLANLGIAINEGVSDRRDNGIPQQFAWNLFMGPWILGGYFLDAILAGGTFAIWV